MSKDNEKEIENLKHTIDKLKDKISWYKSELKRITNYKPQKSKHLETIEYFKKQLKTPNLKPEKRKYYEDEISHWTRVMEVENKFQLEKPNYYQDRLYELKMENEQLREKLKKSENITISEQTPNQKKKSHTTIINPLNNEKVRGKKIQEIINNIYNLYLSAQKTIKENEDDLHDYNLLRNNWDEIITIYRDMENELKEAKKNSNITIFDPLNQIEKKTQDDIQNIVNNLYQAYKNSQENVEYYQYMLEEMQEQMNE